jgi:hypothetical protein
MLILGSPFHVMMCCSGYPPDSCAVSLALQSTCWQSCYHLRTCILDLESKLDNNYRRAVPMYGKTIACITTQL